MVNTKQIRLERLLQLLAAEPGAERGRQARLAKRIGKAPAQISQWRSNNRNIDDETAREIEQRAGKPRWWMDTLDETASASLAGVSVHPVAQPMSLTPFDTPLTLSWEKLMQSKELPARFVVAVPDAAIASEYAQGTEIVFDRSAPPKVGKPVIVQDRSGLRYLRIYGNVRGTRWQALATSVGHATLDSEADGLVLLASAVWVAV